MATLMVGCLAYNERVVNLDFVDKVRPIEQVTNCTLFGTVLYLVELFSYFHIYRNTQSFSVLLMIMSGYLTF